MNTNQIDKRQNENAARRASQCSHTRKVPLGKGYREPYGPYQVFACEDCETRFDAFDAGPCPEYIPTLPPAQVEVYAANDPSEYRPQYDGVDAATDDREPENTNLFDHRGGPDGIGD